MLHHNSVYAPALTLKLPVCSHRSSEYARSETLLLRHSFEYACDEASSALAAKPGEYWKPRPRPKLRCDYCRSFDPFESVEASIHSQLYRPMVLASLTACRCVCQTSARLGGHCRSSVSNHAQTSSDFSIRRFETELSANSNCRPRRAHVKSRVLPKGDGQVTE